MKYPWTSSFRCEATADKLDDPCANLCSHKKTEFSHSKTLILGWFWENYSVCDDVLVSAQPWSCSCHWNSISHLCLTFHEPDIHKLLIPDLLHQLIAGNFQRPSHYLGWRIFDYNAWQSSGINIIFKKLIVSKPQFLLFQHFLVIEIHAASQLCPAFPGLWCFPWWPWFLTMDGQWFKSTDEGH